VANATSSKKVAIIGGGWAGCAAGVELAKNGHRVTLFEVAHTLGGRARRVEIDGKALDNGQHILLGAYKETLRLMRLVGIDSDATLLRLPLQMRYPPPHANSAGGMDFIAPRLPAPFHLLGALLCAKGLASADKMALARFNTAARWMGWRLNEDCTVLELLDRLDQTPRLYGLLWRPLCIAALNTPPERASAQVFLNVLRDSLGARRAASDMLIPKVDLSALFPERAAAYIEQHGGKIRLGHNIRQLHKTDAGWGVEVETKAEAFDAVVIATPAPHAATLLKDFTDISAIEAFEYEPITTCYLQYPPEVRLSQDFFALIDHPEAGKWGQFVFDRGQLAASQAGLFAVVVSVSGDAIGLGKEALATAIAEQLAREFKRPELTQPLWTQVISDRRATFACTPNLARPDNATGINGLIVAGDYTASEYPATLETAIRSGIRAAALI